MSRGREMFRRARPLLLGLSVLFSAMPRFLVEAMWGWLDGVPGYLGMGVRYAMAKRLAASVGQNVVFGEYVYVRGWTSLRIGNNVSIHRSSYVDALGGITIGDDVSIAHQVSMLSFDHTWSDTSRPIRDNEVILRPVHVGNDVWVGCGVRILAGVTIGSRAVVAAGAVVTRDVAGGVIVGGVPAAPIGTVETRSS